MSQFRSSTLPDTLTHSHTQTPIKEEDRGRKSGDVERFCGSLMMLVLHQQTGYSVTSGDDVTPTTALSLKDGSYTTVRLKLVLGRELLTQ